MAILFIVAANICIVSLIICNLLMYGEEVVCSLVYNLPWFVCKSMYWQFVVYGPWYLFKPSSGL